MIRFMIVGLPGLLLAGCATSEPMGLLQVLTYPSPEDPSAAVRSADYRSVIGGYSRRSPAEPTGWRRSGVEIAPVGEAAETEEETSK